MNGVVVRSAVFIFLIALFWPLPSFAIPSTSQVKHAKAKLELEIRHFSLLTRRTGISQETLFQQCIEPLESEQDRVDERTEPKVCRKFRRLVLPHVNKNRKILSAAGKIMLEAQVSTESNQDKGALASNQLTRQALIIADPVDPGPGGVATSATPPCGNLCYKPASHVITPSSVNTYPKVANQIFGAGTVFKATMLVSSSKSYSYLQSHVRPVLSRDNFSANTFFISPLAELVSIPQPSVISFFPISFLGLKYVTISWVSPIDITPGTYSLSLYDTLEHGYVGVNYTTFKVLDSPYALLRGDGDYNNLGIAISGDRWPNLKSYYANLFRLSRDTFSEPLLANYGPSINLLARRSISGLGCQRCLNDNGTWNQNCSIVATLISAQDLLRATSIASLFLNPFVGVPAIIGISEAQTILSRILAGQNDVFECSRSAVDSTVASSPVRVDVKVAYSNGESTRWWRSNVPLNQVSPLELAASYLGSGNDAVISNYVYLGTNRAEDASSWYANSLIYNHDGRTLAHELGHAFGKLPDFYWSDGDTCPNYRSMMCDSNLNFMSPLAPGWDKQNSRANRSYDKTIMINKLNERIGAITSISTGVTFPNPNSYLGNCAARKFRVTYSPNAKQLSYLTQAIYDVSGRLIYGYASDYPAPNDPNTDIIFGERVGIDSSWGSAIGYGWPGIDRNNNLVASAMYFMIVHHGGIQSAAGNGNKQTLYRRSGLPALTANNCSPVD